MPLHTYGYNYFEQVQPTRLNTSGDYNTTGTFAFSARHADAYYGQNRLANIVVTNESQPNQISFSVGFHHSIANRSVGARSSTAQFAGTFISSNQGLFRLNEMGTPTYQSKEAIGTQQGSYFSAVAVIYEKGNQSETFYIQNLYESPEKTLLTLETDSTGKFG
jgi:hypothetical protein